jgi:hypothetical protein
MLNPIVSKRHLGCKVILEKLSVADAAFDHRPERCWVWGIMPWFLTPPRAALVVIPAWIE